MANPIYTPQNSEQQSQNPIANAVQQLKQQYGNVNPRDLAMRIAKERGIPTAQVESLARQLGIKN